jgi:hypothetical protein
MDKKISDTLVKLRQEAVDQYGVTDWGVTYTNDRWIVGFLIKHKRFIGSADNPQDAYTKALHDIEGTKVPPF